MAVTTAAFTAAGATLSISAALPASISKTGYAALTWTLVGEITEMGPIGRVYNMVQHQPLASRGVVKLKGSFDEGSPAMKAAYASGDAGQVIMQAALLSDAQYSHKVTLQDGTILYAEGQVSSAPITPGGVDAVVSVDFNLALKSGTLVIAPAT